MHVSVEQLTHIEAPHASKCQWLLDDIPFQQQRPEGSLSSENMISSGIADRQRRPRQNARLADLGADDERNALFRRFAGNLQRAHKSTHFRYSEVDDERFRLFADMRKVRAVQETLVEYDRQDPGTGDLQKAIELHRRKRLSRGRSH